MGPPSPVNEPGATTTHVYNAREKIGVGASCEVFKGIQRNTGSTHALKIFKNATWSNSHEHQREVEALVKLKHPNIVAFFGREKELCTGSTVLVMEFCQGGSLYSFLQEPENMFGLGEKEFSIFINDICGGLKHLRSRGFVHRDIKPGNILRTVLFDGTIRYKISDFGSSKNIENEEGEFMSLAGTEEYLHPAMYEKAFMQRNDAASFNNAVDLWSLGCTIYHACTGQIPFQPHRGARHNRNTMYIMIACKPNGAISGSQLQDDADILWQNELPHTCLMARTFKCQVQSMIAGLVVADKTKQWTFETFERGVQQLTSMKKFCVLNTDSASVNDIYLSPSSSFRDFQHSVEKEFNFIDLSSFSIFHKNKQLSCSPEVSMKTLADTGDSPIVLIHKTNGRQDLYNKTDPYPTFASSMTLAEDIKTAHKDCWAVNNYHNLIKTGERIHQVLPQVEEILRFEYKEKHLRMQRLHQSCLDATQEKRSHLEMMGEWEGYRNRICQAVHLTLSQHHRKAKELCLKIHNSLFDVQESLRRNSVETALVAHTGLDGTRLQNTNWRGGADTSDMSIRAKHLFEESKSIWQRMKQRLADRPISEFEEMQHKKDKKDLQEICAYSVQLWQDMCHPKTQMLYDQFIRYKMIYFQKDKELMMIEQKLLMIKTDIDRLTEQISQLWAFSGKAWTDLVDDVSRLRYSSERSLSIMKENEKLGQEFQMLLNGLPDVKVEDIM